MPLTFTLLGTDPITFTAASTSEAARRARPGWRYRAVESTTGGHVEIVFHISPRNPWTLYVCGCPECMAWDPGPRRTVWERIDSESMF